LPKIIIGTPVPTPIVYATLVSKVQMFGSSFFYAGGSPGAGTAQTSVFVTHLFNDVLDRAPTTAEVNSYVYALQMGASRYAVVNALWESREHRAIQVAQYYQLFLHRAGSPAEITMWVNAFKGGWDETQVAFAFIVSSEYQALHPGNADFLSALYRDVLGRTADPTGLGIWLGQLQGGLSRAAVASSFLHSGEFYYDVIADAYTSYLHRPVSGAEAQTWLALFYSGQLTVGQFAKAILGSTAFATLPP
jgi:hypothetical protein